MFCFFQDNTKRVLKFLPAVSYLIKHTDKKNEFIFIRFKFQANKGSIKKCKLYKKMIVKILLLYFSGKTPVLYVTKLDNSIGKPELLW